jgi:hypothetical protein
MILRFEYGALDKPPVEVEDPEWFQITYYLIRNSLDEEIAYFSDDGFWVLLETEEPYSDIVIYP